MADFSPESLLTRKDQLAHKNFTVEYTPQNSDQDFKSKWATSISEGKERITVIPGPTGSTVRLHKPSGRSAVNDTGKPFMKKCRNRECNNLGGQIGKPRSIYCSKRCQSREQNLRQGRIKNVKNAALNNADSSDENSREQTQSPISEMGHSSPHLNNRSPTSSPPVSLVANPIPIPMARSISPAPSLISSSHALLIPSPSASPIMMLAPSSSASALRDTNVMPSPLHMLSNSTMLHNLPPSPLTLRLGMTPSPLPLSPSPFMFLDRQTSDRNLDRPIERSASAVNVTQLDRQYSASALTNALAERLASDRTSSGDMRSTTPNTLTMALNRATTTSPPASFAPIPMSASIAVPQTSVYIAKPQPISRGDVSPNVTTTMPAPIRPAATHSPIVTASHSQGPISVVFNSPPIKKDMMSSSNTHEEFTLAPMLS